MNIKSAISSINKYMDEIFNWFGSQSEEYMRALSQVRSTINDNVLQNTHTQGLNYAYDHPTKPLHLSSSKKSLSILNNFKNDIYELRKIQKETGSAIEQAQKYIDELAKDNKQFSRKNIYAMASGLYNFRNNVNEWYDRVDKSTVLSEFEKSYFKEPYSDLNGADEYDYQTLRDTIIKRYRQLKPKLDEEDVYEEQETSSEIIKDGVEYDPNII